MKKIESLIPWGKLDDVVEALIVVGVSRVIVGEVRLFGPEAKIEASELYRGAEYTISSI